MPAARISATPAKGLVPRGFPHVPRRGTIPSSPSGIRSLLRNAFEGRTRPPLHQRWRRRPAHRTHSRASMRFPSGVTLAHVPACRSRSSVAVTGMLLAKIGADLMHRHQRTAHGAHDGKARTTHEGTGPEISGTAAARAPSAAIHGGNPAPAWMGNGLREWLVTDLAPPVSAAPFRGVRGVSASAPMSGHRRSAPWINRSAGPGAACD